LCLFTPIVLELLAPINFFTLSQRNLYIGYVGINVYHNPTIVLLKPVSLLLFWIILDNLELKEFSTKTLLLSIFLVLLDLTIKPNFMLCFLPSIWIYCVWRRFKKQPVNWILLIFGVTLPAILVLLAQYFFTYGSDQTSRIIFSPLKSVSFYIKSIAGILIRIPLSIAFPLVSLALFFKQITRDKRLVVSYIMLIVGLSFMYLASETGVREGHGNFWWTAQIALL